MYTCTFAMLLYTAVSMCAAVWAAAQGWRPEDCKSLKAGGRPDFSLKQGDHIQLSLGQIKEVGSGTQLQSSVSSLLPAISVSTTIYIRGVWLSLRHYWPINDIQSLPWTARTSYLSDFCLGLVFSQYRPPSFTPSLIIFDFWHCFSCSFPVISTFFV